MGFDAFGLNCPHLNCPHLNGHDVLLKVKLTVSAGRGQKALGGLINLVNRYLEGILAKALGGRAAELHFVGPDGITTGAAGDLVQATNVARNMVGNYGMSEEVGLVSADPQAQGGAPSEQLQAQIDDATRALIGKQMIRAEEIVRTNAGAVEAVANALLEHSVLSADQVHAIAEAHGIAINAPRLKTAREAALAAV